MRRVTKRKGRRSLSSEEAVGDPARSLVAAVEKAKRGLGSLGVVDNWDSPLWTLSSSLFSLIGRNTRKVTIHFNYPDSLEGGAIEGDWADVVRALFVIRERRRHKSISSHRTFITVAGYIARAAKRQSIARLTPEILDSACEMLKEHAAGSELYKRHNAVAEFARLCFEHGLCYVKLEGYKYFGMMRPSAHSGRSAMRLDDVKATVSSSDRLIASATFMVLGELYRNIPKEHKYRFYFLVIALLVCTGRRLSEITQLPRQKLSYTDKGVFFSYVQLKGALGSQQRRLRRVPLLTEVVPLVEAIIAEVDECSRAVYACAEEMCRTHGPDLRFLAGVSEHQCLKYNDLLEMGLPVSMFNPSGWLGRAGRIKVALSRLVRPTSLKAGGYLLKADVEAYCRSHYSPEMTKVLFQADGKDYRLNDMLLLRYVGTSSGHYTRWVTQTCSLSMFQTFLRSIDKVAEQYAARALSQRFTSHDFRHTMNDALDRGGLPELLQTEFFGRKNPKDNKAYQHSSPEQRALDIREKIKLGEVGGMVAERVMRLPVDKREAYIITKVRAVHDIGLGMCLHRWQHGPCTRHLECESGCEEFAWLKTPADREQKIDEVMRQLCQNLFSVYIADGLSKESAGFSEDWCRHTFTKIDNLELMLTSLDSELSREDAFDYINSGKLDDVASREFSQGVKEGYDIYIKLRAMFYQQCVDYERDMVQMFPLPEASPLVSSVLGESDDLQEDE